SGQHAASCLYRLQCRRRLSAVHAADATGRLLLRGPIRVQLAGFGSGADAGAHRPHTRHRLRRSGPRAELLQDLLGRRSGRYGVSNGGADVIARRLWLLRSQQAEGDYRGELTDILPVIDSPWAHRNGARFKTIAIVSANAARHGSRCSGATRTASSFVRWRAAWRKTRKPHGCAPPSARPSPAHHPKKAAVSPPLDPRRRSALISTPPLLRTLRSN